MNSFQRAETIILFAEVRSGGVLVDPTAIIVTVTDPAGTVVVNGLAMTKDAVGKYRYDYNPTATAVLGIYHYRVKATSATRTTNGDDDFYLMG